MVSDPNGIPLNGVELNVLSEDGQPGRIDSPGFPDIVIDQGVMETPLGRGRRYVPQTFSIGHMYMSHLPADRAYRIQLYKPGYEPQTIRDVRPGPDTAYFVTLVPR